MWSAFDQPEVQALLAPIEPAARSLILEDLKRSQGASWLTHRDIGPALTVVGLSWWDLVTAAGNVDQVPLESWLAMLEAKATDPFAAAAAVHGFLRLQDLSKVLTYSRVFQAFGGHISRPMCAALVGLHAPTRVFVVRWVADHAPERGEEQLVRCAGDVSKGVREAALGGLRRLGPRVIPGILAHLASPEKEVRRSIISFLRDLQHPDALGPLRRALKKEKSSPLKTEIQKALLACGGSIVAAVSGGAHRKTGKDRPGNSAPTLLAAIEAEPSPKLPHFIDELDLPPIRIESGGKLSKKAVHWLLYRLTLEQHDFTDPESRSLRALLIDADCHELSRILSDTFSSRGSRSDDKWLVYQRAILGSEEQATTGVEALPQLVADHGFVRATWTLDVLARHGSAGALHRLECFSRDSRSQAIRVMAAALMEEVRARLGGDEVQRRVDVGRPSFPFDKEGHWAISSKKQITLSSSGRVDYAPRKKAFDATELAQISRARATVGRAVRDLERDMCDGRRWRREAFEATFQHHPVVRVLAYAMLFFDEASSKLFHMHPITGPTDVFGHSFPLGPNASACIVHPVHLKGKATPEELTQARELLSRLGPPPFPQLDREVYVVDDYRRGETGVQIDSPSLGVSATLRFLAKRGWVTEEESDDTARETSKTLPGGWSAVLKHTGVDVRLLGGSPPEGADDFAAEDGSFHLESLDLDGPNGAKVWDAPPILFSEVMRELGLALRAGAPPT